jgi:TonB C terminal
MKHSLVVTFAGFLLLSSSNVAQAATQYDAVSCDPYVRVYLNQMQQQVVSHWQPDLIANPYLVTFALQVNQQGQLTSQPVIATSSGLAKADTQAMAALKATVPFQRLPACHTPPVMDMTLTLTYTPDTVKRISTVK